MSRSQVRRRRRLFVPIIGAAVLAIGFSAPVASAVQDAGGATIVDGVNDGTVAEGETRADAQQCANYKKWWLADVKPPNRDLAGATYTRKLAWPPVPVDCRARVPTVRPRRDQALTRESPRLAGAFVYGARGARPPTSCMPCTQRAMTS